MKKFWLVKQEPASYSWSDFTMDKGTSWTGVRNYTARNNLRGMGKGDEVFFYHSGDEKSVVGLAKVKQTAYADPTATEGDWSCVELEPVKPLARPVTLDVLKKDPATAEMALIRNSRLSVTPVTRDQFERVLKLGM